MNRRSRIALRFGAFSCEMEGVEDPVATLQRLVAFCEEVEKRNPEFGQRVAPLSELNASLVTEGSLHAEVNEGRLVLRDTGGADALVFEGDDAEEDDEDDNFFASGAPAARAPATPDSDLAMPKPGAEKEITSIEELEKMAPALPDDALASALDRAMTQSVAGPEPGAKRAAPMLSLRDYAAPRRPRRPVDALEIAAAYNHHLRGEPEFRGEAVLAEMTRIDIGRPLEPAEPKAAFGTLVEKGHFVPVEGRPDVYRLSDAVANRFR